MPAEIGLTGNIGAGKSTVARLFARRGAVVIDADALASEALAEPETVARIAAAFGEEVAPGGRVDRAALAERVFADEAARRRLEAIVHPRVAALREARAREARARRPAPPLIVHDVPLLFEAGLAEAMDAVVVVDAPLATRVARVASRSGLDPDEIRRRDAAQWPAERKRARADVVLDNAGDEAWLEEQLDRAWPALVAAGGSDSG
jgi:dephospho-CoA kinase